MLNRAYSLLTVKNVDGERRVLTGMATTPDPDRVGDIIEPLGVSFKNPLPLLLFHDSKNPVGTVKFSKPTKDGIAFEATISSIDEPGKLKENLDHAWQLVKNGLVRAVSIGFRPLNDALDFMQDTGGIRWRETEVLELSLVTVPANAQATIHTIKSIDGERLAALGLTPVRPTAHTSGVSDTTKKPVALKDAKTMKKTIAEQITAFEATRQAKAASMTEIMQKAADEGVTLDAAQKEEYDAADAEVKEIDEHLVRLRALEKANAQKAAPVAGGNTDEGSRARDPQHAVIHVKNDLPPGIGFARGVMCKAIARLDSRNVEDVAKERFPSDDRLHAHLKAAVPGGTSTQAVFAGPLVDQTNLAGEFIDFLRPQTILGKFGQNGIPSLRRVPFNVRITGQTSGGNGYWVGEGKSKPLTSFAFEAITMLYTKVAAISVLTQELVRFSTPSAEMLVRDALAKALIARLDIDFIDPAHAVSAAVSPASITNGLIAKTSAGTSADNARTDLTNLLSDFIEANIDPSALVVIMPNTLALALSLMRNSLGQKEFPDLTMRGGLLEGIPVIASQYAANASGGGNLVIAVNADEIFLADDGGVTIDASTEASLQMSDAPTGDATSGTGVSVVSMYQTNSIALRAERFINWKKRRAEAVVYMDDVNWGSVGSPA